MIEDTLAARLADLGKQQRWSLRGTAGSLDRMPGGRLCMPATGDAISCRADVARRFGIPSDTRAAVFPVVVDNAGR